MPEAPKKIKAVFNSLKKEFPFFISLDVLNGHYYVYKRSTVWDRESKRVRSKAEYLGKIEKGGKFVKKERAHEAAQPIVQSENIAMQDIEADPIDKKLLTILSMNARATLTFLGKPLGLKPSATYYRVKQLEKAYGLQYTIDINTEKLGFLDYIAFVKFEEEMPSIEEIRDTLSGFPEVQLALSTTGDYDLIIYFVSSSNDNAANFLYRVRTTDVLGTYKSKWFVSTFYISYGFAPLRDEFFDLLKAKVWVRSKENPRPGAGEITQREFDVLRELNKSGTVEFTDIDSRYSYDKGSSQYTYHKLKERGIIRRPTMTMQRLPIKYSAALMADMLNGSEFSKSRPQLLLDIIEEFDSLTNKYCMVGDVGMPDGILFLFPVFGDGDVSKIYEEIKEHVKGIKLNALTVTGAIVGKLGFRRFDNAYSRQLNTLIVEHHMGEAREKMDYEETGRKTKPGLTAKEAKEEHELIWE